MLLFRRNVCNRGSPPHCHYWLILLAVFAFNLSIAVSAHATDYFVATNGSDSNPGTEAAPFRTIAHATDKMVAGDTTYVKGSTDNERMIWFKKSGTPSSPIQLFNAPGETPTIHFTDNGTSAILIAAGSGMGSRLPIGWITVVGFEIENGSVAFRTNDMHDVIIRRNWIHDHRSQGILGNGKNVLVDRNIISHNGDFARCAAGLDAAGTSNGSECNKDHGMYVTGTSWTITNNLIYDNLAMGITVAGYPFGGPIAYADSSFSGASGWLIANNTFAYNSYGTGVIVWQAAAVNITIKNNIFYENGQKLPGGIAQGVSLYHSGGGHVIQNNLFYATGAGATASIDGTSGWQSKYTESGNLTVNPNFMGAPATMSGVPNFKLPAGSPAIDTGLTLSQVTWDHDGGKRPFGAAYDIGAYEFGAPPDSGSPSPLPPGGSTPVFYSPDGRFVLPAITNTLIAFIHPQFCGIEKC